MFRSEQQQGQSGLYIPTESWYPPSVLTPTNLSRVSSASNITTSSGSSQLSEPGKSNYAVRRFPQSPSGDSPTTASFTATFPPLRNKSVEELRKLLTDQSAYNEFLHSLEQVQTFDVLHDDLRRSNIELAKQNLEQESKMAELKNQCAIIRTMELAAAQERLEKVQQQERELIERFSAPALFKKIQEATDEVDEESEMLHQRLLTGEMELMDFIAKYKELRVLYHRRVLTRMAATASAGLKGP